MNPARRRGNSGHRRPALRKVNGILLLDKPVGLTSNKALQQVKRLFAARKAGHTGSLDPLASGLLPLCFGEATKISAFLLDAVKGYRVHARLGEKTATADADGEVIATGPAQCPPTEQLLEVLSGFEGDIEQVPPMYSALKHKGERLYDLARKGVEVERKARPVTIHRIALEETMDDGFVLSVRCSKGTYVRTLVEDIAERLGTVGHVSALRRLVVGPYGSETSDEDSGMVTLETLKAEAESGGYEALDARLRPIDSAIAHWPAVTLGRDSAYYLGNGQPVVVPGAPESGWVRLYGQDERFLGMGEMTGDGRVAPRRLLRA